MGYAKYLQYKKGLKRKATPAEKRIRRLLNKLRITYNFQKIFFKASAIVDFYMPDISVIIEVDGRHHQKPLHNRKDEERTQRIMREYERISLIRIPNKVALRLTETPLKAIVYSVAHKHIPPFRYRLNPLMWLRLTNVSNITNVTPVTFGCLYPY